MQHDAQELLVFLLDTLHEDLNLISQKPYIELADIDGRTDDVRQCAADAWVNTWKRERSFVFDLFQGQTQSTLECPSCGHQSITFEPFMSLPLAIPENSHRVVHLTLVRRLLVGQHDGKT
jgi:ubiquitin C-terminal hydrolase